MRKTTQQLEDAHKVRVDAFNNSVKAELQYDGFRTRYAVVNSNNGKIMSRHTTMHLATYKQAKLARQGTLTHVRHRHYHSRFHMLGDCTECKGGL